MNRNNFFPNPLHRPFPMDINPFIPRLTTVFVVIRQDRGVIDILGVFSTRIGAEGFVSNRMNDHSIQIRESIFDPLFAPVYPPQFLN